MNSKILPSERKDKLFQELLASPQGDAFREFFQRGMEKLLQEALEGEVTDFLGRDHYEHRDPENDEHHTGYRNGYYDRSLLTAEGPVKVRQPRVRASEEPFESQILERFSDLEENLKRLSREMYVRGLSTRDIEQTLIDKDGRPLLSRSSVSKLNEQLKADYERFRTRDLSSLDVVYLFVDGVYEAVRSYTHNQAILVAWAVMSDGSKQLIHLMAVQAESTDAWEVFFQDMLERGLRQPLLVTTDGGKGAIGAIAKCFPKADRQRCLAHKLRNIQARLPLEKSAEVLDQAKAVYYAPDEKTGTLLAERFINQYGKLYPGAVQSFSDDLEASLTQLRYPSGHRRFIRTTNLCERSFVEEKRRTKIMPEHSAEANAVALVFGILERASRGWQRVRMTSLELAQLRNIRKLIVPKDDDSGFMSYRLAV